MESQSIETNTDKHEKKSIIAGLLQVLRYKNKSYCLLILTSFCVSVQYYSLIFFIPLYFSIEFGFTDLSAGLVFGIFGALIGSFSIIFSYFTYRVSLKAGLSFSIFLGILGFALLLLNNRYAGLTGILIQSASCSLTWPYIEFGIKENSKEEHRNICTSIYYISTYSAGILTGTLIDSLTSFISDYNEIFRIIYSISIISLLFSLGFILACDNCYINNSSRLDFTIILTDQHFWKYSLLIFLLIILRSFTFGHLDATIPKYIQKLHGQSYKFGSLITLYSVLMIVFTLICTYLTNFLSNFKLILIGSVFGVLSLVPLIFSDDYKSFCLFVTAASIGESILTPRLLDYTYFVARKKQEGVYLAIASLPYYFSMIVTGSFSGFMMEKFCGNKDEEECRGLWKYSIGAGILTFVILAGLAKRIKFEDDSGKYIEISEENVKDPDLRLATS